MRLENRILECLENTTMLLLQGHRSQISRLAFSPNGSYLASIAGKGYAVSLWNALEGERLSYLSVPEQTPVTSFAFTPDGTELVAGTSWGRLLQWDLNQKRPTFVRKDLRIYNPICEIAFANPGPWCTIASHGYYSFYSVWRWDRGSDRKPKTGWGRVSRLVSVAFDPMTTRAVVACEDGNLHIWNMETCTREREEQYENVKAVAWSPVEQLIAIAQGNEVVLRDPRRTEEMARLTGHTDAINGLAFTPDGRSLVSGSDDGTVRVWDVPGRCERMAFNWDIGRVTSVAVARDGMRAAAGGRRAMMIWDVEE